MCGILGYIDLEGRGIDRGGFSDAVDILAHRGPDDRGVEFFDGRPSAALGHRRLSIIDLSSAGHQPMSNEDGNVWIVYNGEIYNFKDLRVELSQKGHTFRSHTDTEVIIHAYEEWGEKCLEYFNGMFAFAIWDKRKKKLFAARDRLGVKPFYYRAEKDTFQFASEIKALLGFGERNVDKAGLRDFLMLQYVPWPNTLFGNIKKLPPAHSLVFDRNGLRISRYWSIPVEKDHNIRFGEAKERLYELVKDSVKSRLISDVPLGTFLSGGIDSSVVTYLTKQENPDVNTFTIGFNERHKKYDETRFAEIFTNWAGVKKHVATCDMDEACSRMPKLIWNLDEPIAQSLIYPYNELCRSARTRFTVSLSGEGADEFLYGYRYYTLEGCRRFMPRSGAISARLASENVKYRALGYLLSPTVTGAFNVWNTCFGREEMGELLGFKADYPDIGARFNGAIGVRPSDDRDFNPWLDQHFRMTDFILTSTDKMSMAEGLEQRVPFLDHRLVEFMASLPCDFKIKNGHGKYILRETFKDILPRELVLRRKKPFSAPIEAWLYPLAQKVMNELTLVKDGLLTDKVRKYNVFDGNRLALYPRKLWNIVMLEMWYRIFIKRSGCST